MNTQIKIDFANVEQVMIDLQTTAQELEPVSIPPIHAGQLDMIDTLNGINQELDDILTSYQTLLMNNNDAASRSVESMKATDEQAAQEIQLFD
ncbi:YwqI/YxiC family protein [Lentibacillus sp. N15]|uniref:YwqI/YxiC family protein n=1 Tax=Lentibacillus songyuanensis TaxID=3136161 RepID=UPI0031BA9707